MDRLSVEVLKQHLDYVPGTGIFTRRMQARGRKHFVGARAGSMSHGYRYIRVCINRYAEHHLAWLYVYGVWPSTELDHVNGDKGDNRIENLREASRGQNMANAGVPRTNKSGMKGVFFDAKHQHWLASMTVEKKTRYIGIYDTFEEAAKARRAAFTKQFGEFARV